MKALVLVSGGLDSTVALWWACREATSVVPLTFHYPGRPRGEMRATRNVTALAGLVAREADMPFLVEAADADPRFLAAPPGYIPARNALFYAAACHQAQILGCDIIVGGHNADDSVRFPDAEAGFFDELGALLGRGLWKGIAAPQLVMPLIGLDRDGVLSLGRALGAPVEETWSCYEDGEGPCGACPACERRGDLPSMAHA